LAPEFHGIGDFELGLNRDKSNKRLLGHENGKINNMEMKPIAMTEWNIESEGTKQKVSAVAG